MLGTARTTGSLFSVGNLEVATGCGTTDFAVRVSLGGDAHCFLK